MGNVGLGDSDEILTAAADWRVERKKEKREKGDMEGGILEDWSQTNSWIKTA